MRANLLRAISHDLRTTLTAIIGSSSAYLANKKELSEAEQEALVSGIHEDANWLLNMVENLLTVTRINADTASVVKTEESVEEVVAEAVTRLKKRLPDISVRVKVPDCLLYTSTAITGSPAFRLLELPSSAMRMLSRVLSATSARFTLSIAKSVTVS